MRTVAVCWALLALALAACGDDDDAPPSDAPGVAATSTTTSTTPPTTAAASPTVGEATAVTARTFTVEHYKVPTGTAPHDVAPAPDGTVWFTAQRTGQLGRFDPKTGESKLIPLGSGSSPHGVIVGPDGAAWVTDSGLNAIARVDQTSHEVKLFRLPSNAPNANLNTAAFDGNGVLWWTGQTGYYGRVDPASGRVEAWAVPGGRGPYGITATPRGDIYYASLAGSHIARINIETGEATRIDPPTAGQGARRVWSDSKGNIWVSEWNAGKVGRYDPAANAWEEWTLPGSRPQAYSVYVDEADDVWLTDFGANTIVRFDPRTKAFESFPMERSGSNIRQMLGRAGEVWGAESGLDQLVVVRAAR